MAANAAKVSIQAGIQVCSTSRRSAGWSEWRRPMCARTRRTITDYSEKERNRFSKLAGFGRLSAVGHIEMNAASLADSPLIQTQNDLLDGLRYGSQVALPITLNLIDSLADDVAVPARAFHVVRRLYRLDRHDFVVFINH